MKAAEILLRGGRDPRLEGVHFTRVDVTRDHSRATLWFRTMPGSATREQAEQAATAAASFLRREIGRTLRLRVTPEIVLRYDDMPDEGARIDELLAQVKREHPWSEDAPPADDEE